jgi:hypothetical protein
MPVGSDRPGGHGVVGSGELVPRSGAALAEEKFVHSASGSTPLRLASLACAAWTPKRCHPSRGLGSSANVLPMCALKVLPMCAHAASPSPLPTRSVEGLARLALTLTLSPKEREWTVEGARLVGKLRVI